MKQKYFDWIKFVLGVWIFVSPWVLGFWGINLALWSNMISGALIVIFSLRRMFDKKTEIGTIK